MTTTRASLEEVLEFANKVREAGGGNALDALMPATPGSSEKCLIAKNLNFNCVVNEYWLTASDHQEDWCMMLNDKEIAQKISDSLGLRLVIRLVIAPGVYKYFIVLPDEIGQVAADFDKFFNLSSLDDLEENLKEFLPYIEASYIEARELGTFNEKGELVL